jgi:hypothetical protein
MDRRRGHRKRKGKTGSSKEIGNDMIERAADTNKKRRQTITDNEEAVHAYHEKCTDRDIATTPTQSNQGTKDI